MDACGVAARRLFPLPAHPAPPVFALVDHAPRGRLTNPSTAFHRSTVPRQPAITPTTGPPRGGKKRPIVKRKSDLFFFNCVWFDKGRPVPAKGPCLPRQPTLFFARASFSQCAFVDEPIANADAPNWCALFL
ncbi:hypothetical protein [Pandoravirus japonicus]|uniref:Uncharacterized protein n=1 Tax=Pandoravirus japonicus TaxID=2823154 RepID=A0A811BM29_9VIRU|nr:hypothetical protein [Pandoravirus japonicus]